MFLASDLSDSRVSKWPGLCYNAIYYRIWPNWTWKDPREHLHRREPMLLTSLVPLHIPTETDGLSFSKVPEPQTSRLLQLPLEIRLQILEQVLRRSKRITIMFNSFIRIKTLDEFYRCTGHKRKIRERRKWPLKELYGRFKEQDDESHLRAKPPQGPAILIACRQLYQDGLAILYEANSFCIAPICSFAMHEPYMYLEPLQELHRFGHPGAYTLIQKLMFTWPLPISFHECVECQTLWHDLWAKLGAMKRLNRLSIHFMTNFERPIYNPNVDGRRDIWRQYGVDWLKPKLLAFSHVRRFDVMFPGTFAWMVPEMDLDPEIFRFSYIPNLFQTLNFVRYNDPDMVGVSFERLPLFF